MPLTIKQYVTSTLSRRERELLACLELNNRAKAMAKKIFRGVDFQYKVTLSPYWETERPVVNAGKNLADVMSEAIAVFHRENNRCDDQMKYNVEVMLGETTVNIPEAYWSELKWKKPPTNKL